MVKGILILGTGFGLGYGKALYDQPRVRDGILTAIELLKEMDKEKKRKTEEETEEETGIVSEGVDHLLSRLHDALSSVGDSPDDEPVLIHEGDPVLIMGDLRAPFSLGPYPHGPNQDQDNGTSESHDDTPQGESS